MRTTLYVISGFHLRGAPSSDPHSRFQMCPPPSQGLLVNFLDRLLGGSDGASLRPMIVRERRSAQSAELRFLPTLTACTGETQVSAVAWLPFVVEVMNSLTPQCAFTDLLKSEDP